MTYRYIIVGLGNIGTKRKKALGKKCISTVDVVNKEADYKKYTNVPLDIFDIAVLTTPPKEKNEMLEYFLKKGKHVVVEKPLELKDKKELDRINLIAKKNNVIWYTSYNHRFEPLLVKLKEILNAGGIGELYFGKIIYGFGTVRLNLDTWRDSGLGVITEIGTHLINFVPFFLDKYPNPNKFKLIDTEKIETNKSYDYCWFLHSDTHLLFHCSWETWKNKFEIELFGSKGSLHMYGLNKWGGSKLFHRRRVYPSGVPEEKIYESSMPDETWIKDFEMFEKRIGENKTSYDDDLFMLNSLNRIKRDLE